MKKIPLVFLGLILIGCLFLCGCSHNIDLSEYDKKIKDLNDRISELEKKEDFEFKAYYKDGTSYEAYENRLICKNENLSYRDKDFTLSLDGVTYIGLTNYTDGNNHRTTWVFCKTCKSFIAHSSIKEYYEGCRCEQYKDYSGTIFQPKTCRELISLNFGDDFNFIGESKETSKKVISYYYNKLSQETGLPIK